MALFDGAAQHPSDPKHVADCAIAQYAMVNGLVVGNTRVGSTWLLEALRDSSEIESGGEIRWLMPYLQELQPGNHFYVGPGFPSIFDTLTKATRHSRVKVMKLKFDPYGFVDVGRFEALSSSITGDTRTVFLRRRYFDLWQTWKVIGIRHLADATNKDYVIRRCRNQSEIEKVHRFFEQHSAPLQHAAISIVPEGYISTGDNSGIIDYPISSVIDDFLVLYYNDIVSSQYLSRRSCSLFVKYEELQDEFSAVVEHFDVKPWPRMSESLSKTALRRIEPHQRSLVGANEALNRVSDQLAELRNAVDRKLLSIEDLIERRDDKLLFHIPELGSMIADDPLTSSLNVDRSCQQWLCNQPFYNPRSADEMVQCSGEQA